jgi:hypothetical protein
MYFHRFGVIMQEKKTSLVPLTLEFTVLVNLGNSFLNSFLEKKQIKKTKTKKQKQKQNKRAYIINM